MNGPKETTHAHLFQHKIGQRILLRNLWILLVITNSKVYCSWISSKKPCRPSVMKFKMATCYLKETQRQEYFHRDLWTSICGKQYFIQKARNTGGGRGRRDKAEANSGFGIKCRKTLKICTGCRKCHSGPTQLPRRDYRKDPWGGIDLPCSVTGNG